MAHLTTSTLQPSCLSLCDFRRLVNSQKCFINRVSIGWSIKCMPQCQCRFILNLLNKKCLNVLPLNNLYLRFFVFFKDNKLFFLHRIDHQKKATEKRKNIITGEEELFVPTVKRAFCITLSCFIIFLVVRFKYAFS